MPRREKLEIGGLSFRPLQDAEPFPDFDPGSLLGRALATWIFATISGGVILTGAAQALSRYLDAPDIADLNYLGFILGGVLGFLIAAVGAISAVRRGP